MNYGTGYKINTKFLFPGFLTLFGQGSALTCVFVQGSALTCAFGQGSALTCAFGQGSALSEIMFQAPPALPENK
jgi:hypothetical protein